MFTYTSSEKFAGQVATVGRVVIVGTERGPVAALIRSIDDQRGVALFVPPLGASAAHEGAVYGYEFVECKDAEDTKALKRLQWSWPPRI
jgi:hypothetical protein